MSERTGPKPKAGRARTATENKQRERARQALLTEEMQKHGYVPVTVFLPESQLEALMLREGEFGNRLSPAKLSFWVFQSLGQQFASWEITGNDPFTQKLRELLHSGRLPEYSLHEIAGMKAHLRFQEWCLEQDRQIADSMSPGG